MAQPSEFCMPLLLRTWGLERTTGTLTVTAPYPASMVNIVLVENGAVVFATSRSRRDPTAELFLELFQLPDADPENSDELERIERQVTRVVTDMFDWQVANTSFHDGIHLTRWPKLPLSVADLMLRGMRSVGDTNKVMRWIGDIGQVFQHAADPFRFFTVPLKPEEAYFLSRIDGQTSVGDLLSGAGVERDLAARLVAALMFSGAIEPIPDPKIQQPWIGASSHSANVGTPKLKPQNPVIDVKEAARFWYLVEEKLRDVEAGRDYYALLEVERKASVETIQVSYDRLSKLFHPDRYRHLAPGHIDVERQLDTIFDSLTTACVVLTNENYREVYDSQLHREQAGQGVRVEAPHPNYTTHPLRPPGATAANRPNSGPISSNPDASPPRPSAPLPRPASAPLRPPTPLPRPTATSRPAPQPVPSPAATSPQPPPTGNDAPTPRLTASFSAEEWFKRGAQFAAVGDHERAVHAFERAIQAMPDNPQLLVAFGRSLAHVQGKKKLAEEALLKAVKLAPLAPVPLLELGMLYMRTGKKAEAKNLLEQALKLKPNLTAALEALKELEDSERRGASGLLRKFLKT